MYGLRECPGLRFCLICGCGILQLGRGELLIWAQQYTPTKRGLLQEPVFLENKSSIFCGLRPSRWLPLVNCPFVLRMTCKGIVPHSTCLHAVVL